jgi:hypothetical protein
VTRHLLRLQRREVDGLARKSHRSQADVESWVERQGYALERETAATLNGLWFQSTLGRHYVDVVTDKVREIDLVAEAVVPSSRVALFAVIECKRSSPAAGAWIARESALRRPHREWAPIMSPDMAVWIKDLVGAVVAAFPLGRDRYDEERVAFSVVEATDESNDVAYDAIRQAVDGALGWARERDGLALCVPVVVMDVPLFALYHADGGDEPLVEVPWRRVLWGTPSGQTVVDVVTTVHLLEYAGVLRNSLEGVARFLGNVDNGGA